MSASLGTFKLAPAPSSTVGLFRAVDGACALLVVALVSLFFGAPFIAGVFIFLALGVLASARGALEPEEAPDEATQSPPEASDRQGST